MLIQEEILWIQRYNLPMGEDYAYHSCILLVLLLF